MPLNPFESSQQLLDSDVKFSAVLGPIVLSICINAFFYGFSALQFVQYRTRLFRDNALTQWVLLNVRAPTRINDILTRSRPRPYLKVIGILDIPRRHFPHGHALLVAVVLLGQQFHESECVRSCAMAINRITRVHHSVRAISVWSWRES